MVLLSRVDRPGRTSESRQNGEEARASTARGFGGRAAAGASAKGARGSNKRRKGLSRADWGPLGKHPDVDAIVARQRQRLHLPLSGRLSVDQVNRAWKQAAAEHHPDRGGAHDTMQLVNGARDLLLGRDGDIPLERPEERRRSDLY
ncbi:hypothetical protein KBY97_10565 [Synechococcus sp. ATX 2A4]|uniref:hypothetical protein n=1 Tax=Synechococcus sp. ATX 2A4 TaxID=2823727 RepID=UPI0020CF8A76|nr:hypothetical protein [Synechococcus sp. ATX 2A4]MCP9885562.1 hypothetical protein [Synechococcus sp. ATX 2A4]